MEHTGDAPDGEAPDGEAPDEEAPDVEASALARRAEALTQEGRFTEAEPLYRDALGRLKARVGKQDPRYGAGLYALARVLSAQRKHAEAEGLLRRALAIFERTPGPSHPAYEQALHTLAGVLAAGDKFADAEALLRAALAVQEQALGADHPSLGPTLTNLAIALVQEQRLTEAEPVVERSLRLAEAAHGEAHAETARILTILAQIQDGLGADTAQGTARRALAALAATHGPDHPLVGDAEPILREIAEPNVELDALLDEGADALEARDLPRALAILEPLTARARREGLLPLEASAAGMLAQALFVSGRHDEARAHAARALTIAEDAGEEEATAHFRNLLEAMDGARG